MNRAADCPESDERTIRLRIRSKLATCRTRAFGGALALGSIPSPGCVDYDNSEEARSCGSTAVYTISPNHYRVPEGEIITQQEVSVTITGDDDRGPLESATIDVFLEPQLYSFGNPGDISGTISDYAALNLADGGNCKKLSDAKLRCYLKSDGAAQFKLGMKKSTGLRPLQIRVAPHCDIIKNYPPRDGELLKIDTTWSNLKLLQNAVRTASGTDVAPACSLNGAQACGSVLRSAEIQLILRDFNDAIFTLESTDKLKWTATLGDTKFMGDAWLSISDTCEPRSGRILQLMPLGGTSTSAISAPFHVCSSGEVASASIDASAVLTREVMRRGDDTTTEPHDSMYDARQNIVTFPPYIAQFGLMSAEFAVEGEKEHLAFSTRIKDCDGNLVAGESIEFSGVQLSFTPADNPSWTSDASGVVQARAMMAGAPLDAYAVSVWTRDGRTCDLSIPRP